MHLLIINELIIIKQQWQKNSDNNNLLFREVIFGNCKSDIKTPFTFRDMCR